MRLPRQKSAIAVLHMLRHGPALLACAVAVAIALPPSEASADPFASRPIALCAAFPPVGAGDREPNHDAKFAAEPIAQAREGLETLGLSQKD